MAAEEICEQCNFQWGAVSSGEIPDRVLLATNAFVTVLAKAATSVSIRPTPERWSILEYGGHLRDVLISIRERVILASIQEEPTGVAMFRDERVSLGLYRLDTAADVANELTVLSHLFAKTFQSLPANYEQRLLTYSMVTPRKVTILWAGAQAVHECEHHLGDVQENLTLLGTA
jgi:hypothetical protein